MQLPAAALGFLKAIDLAMLAGAAASLVIACYRVIFTRWRCRSLLEDDLERTLVVVAITTSILGAAYLVMTILSRPVFSPNVVELAIYMLPVGVSLTVLFARSASARPIVEAVAALYLAVQLAIGMSGFGFFFVPTAAAMLFACVTCLLRSHSVPTQPPQS